MTDQDHAKFAEINEGMIKAFWIEHDRFESKVLAMWDDKLTMAENRIAAWLSDPMSPSHTAPAEK